MARNLALASLCALLAAPAFCLAPAYKVPEIVASVDASGGSPSPDELKTLQEVAAAAQKTGKKEWMMIVHTLGAEKNYVPAKVTIHITYGYDGVAGTANDNTDVSAKYALRRPDDIPGVIVHEFAHVVQHYTHDVPGWLVEGIADYVRWFNYEPENKRPHPRPDRADARGSYQTTAAFLNWAVRNYDRNLVKQLNQACYDGTYTEAAWTRLTGKSLDALDEQWKAELSAAGEHSD